MTRLDHEAYLAHLRSESARFAAVLATCPPDARVPSCPDWDGADLLWHLTGVQHFWHHIVSHRPTGPEDHVEAERPASYDDLLALFRATHERLASALAEADPAEPAWTWARDDQSVGFTYRRQAQEALIHRLDAELTAGDVTPLPVDLAADGVDEALDVIFGGMPDWGRFDPLPLYVEYRISDANESVWAQLGTFSGTAPDGTERSGESDQHVVPAPGRPADLVVTGTAERLDAWLWHRCDATGITFEGDDTVRERVAAVLDQPID